MAGKSEFGDDDKPYTTLMYTNGNGFNDSYIAGENGAGARRNISGDDTTAYDYLQLSAVPLDLETHGGEDVAIYATGELANMFKTYHGLPKTTQLIVIKLLNE